MYDITIKLKYGEMYADSSMLRKSRVLSYMISFVQIITFKDHTDEAVKAVIGQIYNIPMSITKFNSWVDIMNLAIVLELPNDDLIELFSQYPKINTLNHINLFNYSYKKLFEIACIVGCVQSLINEIFRICDDGRGCSTDKFRMIFSSFDIVTYDSFRHEYLQLENNQRHLISMDYAVTGGINNPLFQEYLTSIRFDLMSNRDLAFARDSGHIPAHMMNLIDTLIARS